MNRETVQHTKASSVELTIRNMLNVKLEVIDPKFMKVFVPYSICYANLGASQ
jgi:hypothetical protein